MGRKEMTDMPMSKKAKAAKAAYLREWYRKHPEKRRKYAEKYWKRRAAKLSESVATATDSNIITPKEEKHNEKQ